jgi:hypothetical protein
VKLEKNADPKELEAMKQNPATARWLDYDLSMFGKPDTKLEDNQTYKLGDLRSRSFSPRKRKVI